MQSVTSEEFLRKVSIYKYNRVIENQLPIIKYAKYHEPMLN